ARWVHFVDLDRAFGHGDNQALARRFLAAVEVKVQVGGGLRTDDAIEEVLAWGAARVVIGTKAATDAGIVERLLARHGPERLVVGVDAKNGQVAVRGWTEVFDLTAMQLADRVKRQGARTVIYTDVARDGMLGAALRLGGGGGSWRGAGGSARGLGKGGGGVIWRFGSEVRGYDSLPPTDGASRLAPALAAAAGRGGPVVVVTDGAVGDLGDVPPDLLRRARVVLLPRRPFFDAFVAALDGPRRVSGEDTVRL